MVFGTELSCLWKQRFSAHSTQEVVQTLAECHNPAIKHIHSCIEMGVAVTVQCTTFFFYSCHVMAFWNFIGAVNFLTVGVTVWTCRSFNAVTLHLI